MHTNFIVLFVGTLFCLTSCAENQDTIEETGQAVHEDMESENQESTAETAKLPVFTVEDSSWKIVWHGSSDTDLLVSILNNGFLTRQFIIAISVLLVHQKISIKTLEGAHKLVMQRCCIQ